MINVSFGNLVGKNFATLLHLYFIFKTIRNCENSGKNSVKYFLLCICFLTPRSDFYFREERNILKTCNQILIFEGFAIHGTQQRKRVGNGLHTFLRFRNSIPAVLTSDGNLPFPFPWSDPTAFSSSPVQFGRIVSSRVVSDHCTRYDELQLPLHPTSIHVLSRDINILE